MQPVNSALAALNFKPYASRGRSVPRPPGLVRVFRLLAALAAFARLVAPAAVAAQNPVPKAPVPRVDSVRVDTLRPPAADSAKRVVLPKPPTVIFALSSPN